jgi:hypothetical protein
MPTGKKFCRGCQKLIGARTRVCPHCTHDHKTGSTEPPVTPPEASDEEEDSFKIPKSGASSAQRTAPAVHYNLQIEEHPFNQKGSDMKLSVVHTAGIGRVPRCKLDPSTIRKWMEELIESYVICGYWPSTHAVRALASWAGATPEILNKLEAQMRKTK